MNRTTLQNRCPNLQSLFDHVAEHLLKDCEGTSIPQLLIPHEERGSDLDGITLFDVFFVFPCRAFRTFSEVERGLLHNLERVNAAHPVAEQLKDIATGFDLRFEAA